MEPITLTAIAAAGTAAATTTATGGFSLGALAAGAQPYITGFILLNMGNNFHRNLQAAAETTIFKTLKRAEQKSIEDLLDIFGELAAQEKQNRPVSPQFIEDLEELTTLLCLDACHHRVAEQVYDESAEKYNRQARAIKNDKTSTGSQRSDMRQLLLWDPECAEVFEATKVAEYLKPKAPWKPPYESGMFLIDPIQLELALRSRERSYGKPLGNPLLPFQKRLGKHGSDTAIYGGFVVIERSEEIGGEFVSIWDPECYTDSEATTMDAKQAYLQFNEEMRHSVESLFNRAKELHETQRQLADALRAHDTLLKSYNREDQEEADRKWEEVLKLRHTLVALSQPDAARDSHKKYHPESGTIPHIAVCEVPWKDETFGWTGIKNRIKFESRWKRASFRLVLLMGRFQAKPAVENRLKQIATLFKAVGATVAQRDAIKSCINTLYGALHRRWEEDPWIQKMSDDVTSGYRWNEGLDYSPFADRKFGGWKKVTSKRRVLFLDHHDTFQFKSPRQLTEEALHLLIEKMELKSDTYFVRDERRTKELHDILEKAQDQFNAGNLDAALTEYQNADHHAPNNAMVLSQIAYVQKRTGNLDAAIANYQKANRLAPDDTPPLFHLAHIYAIQGENLQEAVTLMQRALPLLTAQHNRTLETESGNIQKHNSEKLDISCARQILGWLHLQQGEAEKALSELENPEHQQFASPLFYLVLGDAYKANAQPQEAEHAWQTGWQLANTDDWTDRASATPFEADQHAAQRADLGERLGRQENTDS